MTSSVATIAEQVRDRVRREGADLTADPALVGRLVRDEVRRYSELALGGTVPLLRDEGETARQVVATLTGLGPLQPLFDDPAIEEILMYVLDLDLPQLLNLLLAVVFPILVGVVATRVTSSKAKAVLLATISLVSGFVSALLAALLAGVPFDVISALLTGGAAWLIAIATHFGFWRPTGVTEKLVDVGRHL